MKVEITSKTPFPEDVEIKIDGQVINRIKSANLELRSDTLHRLHLVLIPDELCMDVDCDTIMKSKQKLKKEKDE